MLIKKKTLKVLVKTHSIVNQTNVLIDLESLKFQIMISKKKINNFGTTIFDFVLKIYLN